MKQSSNTSNEKVIVKSFIVEDSLVYLSDQLPDLYVKDKDMKRAYNIMAYMLDTLMIEKYGSLENAKKVQLETEDIPGISTLQ